MKSLIYVSVFLLVFIARAQNKTIASPNGNLKVIIDVIDGGVIYTVRFDNTRKSSFRIQNKESRLHKKSHFRKCRKQKGF